MSNEKAAHIVYTFDLEWGGTLHFTTTSTDFIPNSTHLPSHPHSIFKRSDRARWSVYIYTHATQLLLYSLNIAMAVWFGVRMNGRTGRERIARSKVSGPMCMGEYLL